MIEDVSECYRILELQPGASRTETFLSSGLPKRSRLLSVRFPEVVNEDPVAHAGGVLRLRHLERDEPANGADEGSAVHSVSAIFCIRTSDGQRAARPVSVEG